MTDNIKVYLPNIDQIHPEVTSNPIITDIEKVMHVITDMLT